MMWRPKKRDLLALLPARVVHAYGSREDGRRYLTFDDGPHPEHTPVLLDFLAQHQIKAMFFLIGDHAERHPQIVERIVASGHVLGNHSYSHPMFSQIGIHAQLEEIDRCDTVLAAFDGIARHPFRPPRGELSLRLLFECIRRRQTIIYWSYDSLDYRTTRTHDDLAARMRANPPPPGSIILMHDDADCARRVLETMLPEWRQAGFRFDLLPAG